MDKRDVKHYAVPEWADTLAVGSGEPISIAVVKAAPALLEALEEIVAYTPDKYLLTAHLDKARAAIAQAKGETK